MSGPINVWCGTLSRSWSIVNNGKKHVISLYHDTLSGMRSISVNFEEVMGLGGISSVLMSSSEGHKMSFTIEGSINGYVLIEKKSLTDGFVYSCYVNKEKLNESTEVVGSGGDERVWTITIDSVLQCRDEPEVSDYNVAWYAISATRNRDNVNTTVHRRFQEFVDLFSQVKQALKGHHLYNSLPEFPRKEAKFFYKSLHESENFLQNRKSQLQSFLNFLVAVPYVSTMTCVCSFLGIMDVVREFSVVLNTPTSGLTLVSPEKLGRNNPAIVGSIQRPELCPGVIAGDMLTRTNGLSVSEQTLGFINNRIKIFPRPFILHFVQILSVVRAAEKDPSFYGSSSGGSEDIEDIDINTYSRPPPPPPPQKSHSEHNSVVDGSIRDSTL